MKTTINNNFGLKIEAQYVADRFAPRYFTASKELVENVINTATFEVIEKNGLSLIKLFVLDHQLGAAWFRGGKYTEYTHVNQIQGLIGNVKENADRMELLINKS